MNKPTDTPIVLYIEDDPASKKLLGALLDTYPDIKLITAWSAEEGIKLAEQHQPQLIFLDINLPCMCGREAVQHLQSLPQLANTRIIALSADAIPAHIDSALELGFHGYLTKPVNLSNIAGIIDKLLTR